MLTGDLLILKNSFRDTVAKIQAVPKLYPQCLSVNSGHWMSMFYQKKMLHKKFLGFEFKPPKVWGKNIVIIKAPQT